MTKNPILDKLHATRERLLAESGGTVSGLLDRLRADQAASKRPIYKPANNPMQRNGGSSRVDMVPLPRHPLMGGVLQQRTVYR